MLNLPLAGDLLGQVLGVGLPDHALAYIGPGAGLGAFIVAIALGLGVLLLLTGLVWYPLKRLFNSRAADTASASPTDEVE